MRIRPESTGFTFLIGALTGLPSLSTDMGLPALGAIAVMTGGTMGQAGLTLSMFLLGLAVGPLAYGPLSDSLGRRPVLIAGCVLFFTGAALCAQASSIHLLLLWRFLQGLGAGASNVIAFAIVRDVFEGAAARTRLSQAAVVRVCAPMVAPTIGSLILPVAGPRGIYGAMAIAALIMLMLVIFGLEETAPRFTGRLAHAVPLLPSYGRVLGNRRCIGYCLVNASSFGCQFAYVTGSSLVLIGVLGLTPQLYGLCFAGTAAGIMVGFTINARLAKRGAGRTAPLLAGMVLATTTAAALLAATLAGVATIPVVVPLFILNSMSFGLITPNATQGAMEPLPEVAGVASAVLSVLMMTVGAGTGFLVSVLDDGHSALATAGVMLASTLAALAAFLVMVWPAERRRRFV